MVQIFMCRTLGTHFQHGLEIRESKNFGSSDWMGSNAEIQSSNMLGSRILNIRKVRVRSDMQSFEFFGQPNIFIFCIISVSKQSPP